MTLQESLHLYKQQKLAIGISYDTVQRVTTNVMMLYGDMKLRRIGGISTEKILEWGDAKRRSGIKPTTLATYYNSIRTYVRFVQSQGISVDVSLERIRYRATYGRRMALRPHQIRKIISFADPQTGVLINFMYMTGLRISEASSISADNIGDNTTIYVRGKGGYERPVFVDKDMLAKLQLLAIKNGGSVFVDQYGIQLSRKKAYYYIKKAMIDAGYEFASPHILRHSFATELLRKGVSLSHTSRLMGHSSVAVTEVYAHLLTDDIRRAHRKLTKV